MGASKVYKTHADMITDRNNRQLEKLLNTCKPSRKDIYRRFIGSYKMAGASPNTICMHIESLILWDKRIEQDFDLLTPIDLENVLYTLEETQLSQRSKDTYKLNLRTFLKYAGRDDLRKSFVFKRNNKTKLPEDLLTKDEVSKMIDAALNPRDKAIISLLYESGARRGELLSLQLKHITPHDKGFYIHFPQGKTGARKILVVYSAMFINQWLTVHPTRDKRETYFFSPLDDGSSPMTAANFVKILAKAANRAGIQKKVNPHSFRHAQATALAKDFTEQQMKNYLGWSKDSKMASIYVHLSGRDMDDAILKKNGIEMEERDTRLKPEECPRCHHVIPNGVKFCGFCGLPLTGDATDENKKALDNLLEGLKAHPEILIEALAKLNKG